MKAGELNLKAQEKAVLALREQTAKLKQMKQDAAVRAAADALRALHEENVRLRAPQQQILIDTEALRQQEEEDFEGIEDAVLNRNRGMAEDALGGLNMEE